MAAEDKNSRLVSALVEPPKNHKSEHDVDIYAIIFLALAVVIYLRLRSVLGQHTHQRGRIPVTGILLTVTAAALGAVSLDVSSAMRYPVRTTAVSTTAAPTISGSAHVIDGDTVVVAGTTVRLKGVDAAELGTARGEDARRVMDRLVIGRLTCRLTGEKTHGREVGYCATADGTDINRAIIAQGAALACPRYDERYVPFEQAAALAVQPRSSYCVKRF
jgi:endonuclease YncB( thermonuclease family)